MPLKFRQTAGENIASDILIPACSLIANSKTSCFFCRNWNIVQTFGLLNARCLFVSTCGLSLLCGEDSINSGDTRQKPIISELPP